MPELGFEPQNALLQAGSNGLDFDGFPNSVLLGQNLAEILFLLWLAFWTKKLQKHNWKRIPYGIAEKNSKKTQRLTHLWPKARSSFFSEWTVVCVSVSIVLAVAPSYNTTSCLYSQLILYRHSAGHQKSVHISEVSLYPKSHYNVLQLDGTLLWAWKICRYSRIVVISAVVISQVDCNC